MNSRTITQLAAAQRRVAETLEQADGLPMPAKGVAVVFHRRDGSPVAIIELGRNAAWEWAHHLNIRVEAVDDEGRPTEFRGWVNDVRWSVTLAAEAFDDEPIDLIPTGLSGLVQMTQMFPIVEVR